MSVADWLDRSGLEGTPRWLFATAIGGYASQTVERVSLLQFLWWVARYRGILRALRTGSSHHILEGTQQICLRLATRLRNAVLLSTPVDNIFQADGLVELYAEGRRLCSARRAIVTAPPPVVERIHFEPPLDDNQRQVVTSLHPGHIIKVGAASHAPITARQRANVGGDHLVWTARLHNQLVGYRVYAPWNAAVKDPAAALAEDFGLSPDDISAIVVDWNEEPYARGSYVAFAPGQITRHGPYLRDRHGLVSFAGAERSSMPQQMEGAIESGSHVAEEVSRDLQASAARSSVGQPR
jgi:monoamine oxidase